MAHNVAPRARRNAQPRIKVAIDENAPAVRHQRHHSAGGILGSAAAGQAIVNKHAALYKGTSTVINSTRHALGEITGNSRKEPTAAKDKATEKETHLPTENALKRVRSSSLASATTQRVPSWNRQVLQRVQRAVRPSASAKVSRKPSRFLDEVSTQAVVVPSESESEGEAGMDIEEESGDEATKRGESEVEEMVGNLAVRSSSAGVAEEEEEEEEEEEDVKERDPMDWTAVSESKAKTYRAEVKRVKETFHDEVDVWDTTMVAEYSDDIFEYMAKLENETMPNPTYMDSQSEITWAMRETLVDWLLQVHLRYHMLPETLWIAVNIVDRFLSRRVVSLVKLQLVGVTALFIAAKYEEILAPSVDEFVYMTEQGYSKEEILKGERIILQTLDFKISSYCSPYSWVRRISKADDYDIQTRTLSKFLMEVTLLDYRFLRAKPSLIAAIGMYASRKMLGGDWNDGFVYHSEFTEGELTAGYQFLIEKIASKGFETQYVSKKYANKKFLKASIFAREWALQQLEGGNDMANDKL